MSADAPEQGKKEVFLNVNMPEAEREAVREWAHLHRMSAAKAARRMIRFALASGVLPDDDEVDLRRKGAKKPG